MWESIIVNLLQPEVIGLLIGLVVAWIKSKQWINESFLNEFESDVKAAVTSTYHEYVKSIKNAKKDGKLTEEEKKTARTLALNTLKDIGVKKGKNYAKEHLIPVAVDLIEKWVTKKKKGDE